MGGRLEIRYSGEQPWLLSSRGPAFGPPHSRSDSEPSVTATLGDAMASFHFQGCQAHVWYKDIHAGEAPIHIKYRTSFFKERLCVVVHTCKPSTWKTYAGRLLAQTFKLNSRGISHGGTQL